jgi:hypothetical protein
MFPPILSIDEEKLIIRPKPPLRCKGCGKYMKDEEGAYIVFGGYGPSHMKSKCMERCIRAIRKMYPDWTWKGGAGMLLNKVEGERD